MVYFWLGCITAVSIELLTRIGQSGDGDEPEEHEQEPISISNGTFIKGLMLGLIVGSLVGAFRCGGNGERSEETPKI